MEIEELVENFKNETLDKFRQKLNSLVRENPRYSNLDESNKKIILSLIGKYAERIRGGRGISYGNIRDEMHRIYENRLKLKVTEKDIEDIREILELFKK